MYIYIIYYRFSFDLLSLLGFNFIDDIIYNNKISRNPVDIFHLDNSRTRLFLLVICDRIYLTPPETAVR